MAAKPVEVPMAICEMCWLDEHARWEPESMNESGIILMKLVGVDSPEIVNHGCVEICCMCGTVTIAGIYSLMDPGTVYFFDEDSSKNFEFNLDNVIDDD
jgi:hypothetical protein